MREIWLFDMDGVLIRPKGYHFALKETVRLAGLSIGYGEVDLTNEQIATFEALGISSEWHSSALCMVIMILEKGKSRFQYGQSPSGASLDLNALFEELAAQPLRLPALQRGLIAVKNLAHNNNLPVEPAIDLVEQSESIEVSPTVNWFQELILGSDIYAKTYQKKPQFETESYLKLYDEPLLSQSLAKKILQWAGRPDQGAAIMTNRPSNGLTGYDGAPDARMGAALIGLEPLPVIGYGEISWIADQTGRKVGSLSKPAREHALAAILAASGWPLLDSLQFVGKSLSDGRISRLKYLDGCKVTVFEDTPGGIVSVQSAVDFLNDLDLRIEIEKFGIAEDPAKITSLADHGAQVFPGIEKILAS